MSVVLRSSHEACETIADTLGRVLRDLAAVLGASRAAAFVIEERSGTPWLAATHGVSAGDPFEDPAAACDHVCAARAAGAPRFAPATGPDPPARAGATDRGVGALFSIPLFARRGALLGCLVLETSEPGPVQRHFAETVASVAATAIENADTARRQAEEATRSEALLEIVRQMSERMPLPELLALICRKTVEAFGVRQATVYYHHARVNGYLPLGDHGTPAHVVERFVRTRYTLQTTPHFEEIVAGRVVVITHGADLAPEDRALLDMTDVHALALLPLRTNGQTRGTLVVGTTSGHELTPEQLRGLGTVAHHAATAIYQARSLRASEKAAHFRAAVSALAVELSAETSRARALVRLCARGKDMFGATDGALLLARGGELVGVAADAALRAAAFSVPLDEREHPAVRAFVSGEVMLANRIPKGAPQAAAGGLRSLLAIPLADAEGVGGVLVVGHGQRSRHFDPRMVDEARVLGALAATVLRNLDLLERLHDANAELRRVSALKDQFLANVSHDLRTPLNIIVGYGQLAREGTFGCVPEQLEEILARIVGSGREQLRLVEDLLDLSRMELNTLSVSPAPVPLAPLFADLEFALVGMLRDRPVRGIVRAPAASLVVYADGDRLRQILVNLLGNAAKFTETGTIELEAARGGDVVAIAVRDTGAGIAAEDHARFFEPFRQVEGAAARLGAGLGLAIARRLATLMDGTLTVESAVDLGSTFRLTLPLASSSAAMRTRDVEEPAAVS